MTTPSLFIRNSISQPPLRRGLPRAQQLPRTQAMWIIRGFLLIPLALAWFALSPAARAVDPPPDGGYPYRNTAEGDNALLNLTIGTDNTAIGFHALFSDTTGYFNTANGAFALFNNTISFNNTAVGFEALFSNTIGDNNTANGVDALYHNTTGGSNTANGEVALLNNTTGNNNTAIGAAALYLNKTGGSNTANGVLALYGNTKGQSNTASGFNALASNTTGSGNIALGAGAGGNLTTGNFNIDIGDLGVAAEGNTIRIGHVGTHSNAYIAGISGVTVAGGVGVIVDTNGHLGTVVSSERFKDAIKPMDKASEAILALQPVTFRYKHELDPKGVPQFGLVAEQVEKVNPALVARDAQGKAYTVRYEAVNVMLLNEFLKEHRKVQELEASAAEQQNEIKKLASQLKAQASQIQKVSDQMEMSKPAPRTVANNQ